MNNLKWKKITSSSTALTWRSFSAWAKSSASLSLSRPGLDSEIVIINSEPLLFFQNRNKLANRIFPISRIKKKKTNSHFGTFGEVNPGMESFSSFCSYHFSSNAYVWHAYAKYLSKTRIHNSFHKRLNWCDPFKLVESGICGIHKSLTNAARIWPHSY